MQVAPPFPPMKPLPCCLLLVFTTIASAADLNRDEAAMARAVDLSSGASVELLEKIVNINSGTLNSAGVRQVADLLRPEFEAMWFAVRWVPMDAVGRAGHLIAERQGTHGKRVLLIGHMDTVFELSSPFQKFARQGDTVTGPGVSDMKGGLMILLFALKAMNTAGALEGASITVVLTGDEERPGEPLEVARRDLIEAARHSDAALEFEGGHRSDGREFATIARRSASHWKVEVKGVEAHSSGVFGERVGDGAIYELSRILAAFHDELREPDLTFNVGMVLGGTSVRYDPKTASGTATGKLNIVPPAAFAIGDIRAVSQEQQDRVRGRMRGIVARHLPKTSATIEFEDMYPPMAATEGNKALLRLLNEVNRDLNMESMEALPPSRRGAGDISFVAPIVDSLSGLGSIGGGAHAPGETLDLSRQSIQAKRAALLIYRLTR